MKVYINKYKDHWISPYTIIDYAFFWTDWSKCSRDKSVQAAIDDMNGTKKYVEHPEWVNKTADYLSPISRAIQWVWDKIDRKIDYVKIDYWDTWSMDQTLSPIILPMLKQLKATKHGYGFIDDEDVPNELRSIHALPKETWEWDGNAEKRYEYVLDEMIFAFEHLVDDSWQDAYRSGEIDTKWIPVDAKGNEVPKGEHKYYQMGEGPNHTYKCDYDGIKLIEERIDNGLKLFGKYFRTLWD